MNDSVEELEKKADIMERIKELTRGIVSESSLAGRWAGGGRAEDDSALMDPVNWIPMGGGLIGRAGASAAGSAIPRVLGSSRAGLELARSQGFEWLERGGITESAERVIRPSNVEILRELPEELLRSARGFTRIPQDTGLVPFIKQLPSVIDEAIENPFVRAKSVGLGEMLSSVRGQLGEAGAWAWKHPGLAASGIFGTVSGAYATFGRPEKEAQDMNWAERQVSKMPPGMEAFFPPSVLQGMGIWGAVEEAPQLTSFAAGQAIRSGNVEAARVAVAAMEESSKSAHLFLENFSNLSPTMRKMGEEFIKAYDASLEVNKMLVADMPGGTSEIGIKKGALKGTEEEMGLVSTELEYEKRMLAPLTDEYKANEDAIKSWINTRFEGETKSQEVVESKKFELAGLQRTAAGYYDQIQLIKAYSLEQEAVSKAMRLGVAEMNMEYTTAAKGTAEKEITKVKLEKLRAEYELHNAQVSSTISKKEEEMGEYNKVMLKVDDVKNQLTILDLDYQLKYGQMRSQVKFFAQEHEDAATTIPENAEIVKSALKTLYDRQVDLTSAIDSYKESIKDKEGTITTYKQQIIDLTTEIISLAAAQERLNKATSDTSKTAGGSSGQPFKWWKDEYDQGLSVYGNFGGD